MNKRPRDMEGGRPRLRFTGHIAGVGTSGGTRLVLGRWMRSPHGPFADAWVTEFVAATYSFDEILEVPVQVQVPDAGAAAGSRWHVTAGPLTWAFEVGGRMPLGHMLRAVPGPVGRSLTMARITDRVARWAMPGVRTLGSAGNDRLEWYAARDLHRITASTAAWAGEDLGGLADLDPPAEFGFSSTPRQPSLTTLTSTVRLPR